jgi:hypothetical protein
MLTDVSKKVQLVKHVSSLTVATAQQGEQLSKLKRDNEDVAVAMISSALVSLNNSINIGSNMSEDQIIETAYAILNEYWMLKIDEILLCFRMAKSGRFGKILGLQQSTVMGFLLTYDTELKANHYQSLETVHQTREREENKEQGHIALSSEDIKAIGKGIK